MFYNNSIAPSPVAWAKELFEIETEWRQEPLYRRGQAALAALALRPVATVASRWSLLRSRSACGRLR